MALRLFRATDHAPLREPGAGHAGMHPGWLVLAVSLWLGLVCNVALWRELAGTAADAQLPRSGVLLLAGALAGGSALVLSLLGWRGTLKPAATALLFLGALFACGLWVRAQPVEPTLFAQSPRTWLPTWASLLRWQVPALMLALALMPIAWVWSVPLRRLPAASRRRMVLAGALLGGALLAVSALGLMR